MAWISSAWDWDPRGRISQVSIPQGGWKGSCSPWKPGPEHYFHPILLVKVDAGPAQRRRNKVMKSLWPSLMHHQSFPLTLSKMRCSGGFWAGEGENLTQFKGSSWLQCREEATRGRAKALDGWAWVMGVWDSSSCAQSRALAARFIPLTLGCPIQWPLTTCGRLKLNLEGIPWLSSG